jgi:hypothetical protein
MVAEGWPSAKKCTLPMAPLNSRQWPANRGKPVVNVITESWVATLGKEQSLSREPWDLALGKYIFPIFF